MNNYQTITETVKYLKDRGYSIDFNLGFNGVESPKSSIALCPDKFEITEVHRFKGETDPEDEAIVYAIESQDGHKGILVNGYGIAPGPISEEMIRKLSLRHETVR